MIIYIDFPVQYLYWDSKACLHLPAVTSIIVVNQAQTALYTPVYMHTQLLSQLIDSYKCHYYLQTNLLNMERLLAQLTLLWVPL